VTPEPDFTESEELEVVDGLPVLSSGGAHADVSSSADVPYGLVPSRQAAALAATTFVAGAATVAIAHRRRTAKVLGRRKKRKSIGLGEVVGSNSFLVDVHLLRRD